MALIGGTWSYMTQVPWYPYQLRARPGTMADISVAPQDAFLLNDGTVAIDCGYAWFRLTPDRQGNYNTGSITRMSAKPWVSQYYAAASLADGRLFCGVGEFGIEDHTNVNALNYIYDPSNDSWTAASSTNAPAIGNGDTAMTILDDGRVLVAPPTTPAKIYDPTNDTWTNAGTPNYPVLESGLALRQDGKVLHYQGGYQVAGNVATHGYAEIFDPALLTWTATAFPVDVEAIYDGVTVRVVDMGALVLMPNGDCIQFGNISTGATAVYSAAGAWSAGPVLPTIAGQSTVAAVMDFPIVVLPNGNLLITAGQFASGAAWAGPNKMLEFDGTTYGELANQPTDQPSYPNFAVVLPNGQIMVVAGTGLEFFTPTSVTPPAGKFPVVTDIVDNGSNVVTTLAAGTTYTIRGTRLNGTVVGRGQKDEHCCNENFPIAVLKYGDGTVVYCTTKNTRRQSNGATYMGVDPTASVKTDFVIPANAPNGAATLYVVASGMLSAGTSVTVTGAGATYHAPLTVTAGLGEFYASTFSMYDATLTKWYTVLAGSPTTHPSSSPASAWVNPSFTVSGGTGPYVFTIDARQPLPTGLSLSTTSSGASIVGTATATTVIPATPVSSGFYTVAFTFVTVSVTDANGATGQGHFPMRYALHDPVAFPIDKEGTSDALQWSGPQVGLPQTEKLTDSATDVVAYKRHGGGNRSSRVH